jgi:hypothetical protein
MGNSATGSMDNPGGITALLSMVGTDSWLLNSVTR